jgi:catechol 2,3-dioxygenase-like lactoylglutathione lyase family enzyme
MRSISSVGAVLLLLMGTISSAQVLAQNNSNKNNMAKQETSSTPGVRYIVNNVDSAVAFYTELLGFKVVMHPAPGFAMLSKGSLRLFLNQPGAGGAGKAMPDGAVPAPGGWNRMLIEVENLEETIKTLQSKKAKFRNELVVGNGGKQILLEDPSGNFIELFEPFQ